MNFRLKAFGLHLLGSAGALTLVIGALYLGWYRWPGWYLSRVLHVVAIAVLVDVVLGPTLTLIIANPGKPRRELARDLALIVTVQVTALAYGAATLWGGRPLYYSFSADRLEIVQASDIDSSEVTLARRQNPALAPYWYSLPRWIWAPLPGEAAEAKKILQANLFGGGQDVIDMPRYFKPWDQGLPKLRDQLLRLEDITYLSSSEKQSLRTRLSQLGIAPDQREALPMWGSGRLLLAVFDPTTLRVKAILRPR